MHSSSSYRRSLLLDPPFRPLDPSSLRLDRPRSPRAEKTNTSNPWKSFYLLEKSSKSCVTDWDPWPVKCFRPSELFRAAERIIRQRNEESVDNFLNKIVLLPASNSVAGMHGGTISTELYSIRSPSRLPIRIHLWRTHGGEIMVRKGIRTMTLIQLIETFEVAASNELCQFYDFWSSLKMDEQFLNYLEVPDHLRPEFHKRWWSIHGFPFFDLPAELRAIVLKFAIGHIAEPYARVYRPAKCLPLRSPCANLLLVSRRLRMEALPILFSQVTFVFRHHGQLMRFFEQIPKPSLYAIRSLELRFSHEMLLDFFGAQVFRTSPKAGFSSADYYLKETLFRDRINLRHIRIYFPHPREHWKSQNLRKACQRRVCSWTWAAARRYLRDIPDVEFHGFIKTSQKEGWLEILSLERQGIILNQQEIKMWQKQEWSKE